MFKTFVGICSYVAYCICIVSTPNSPSVAAGELNVSRIMIKTINRKFKFLLTHFEVTKETLHGTYMLCNHFCTTHIKHNGEDVL